MKTIASLLALLSLSGSLGAKDLDFWQWFLKRQERIEAFKEGSDQVIDELLSQLHKYNKHLFLELSVNSEIKELVITAEGDTEQFESVRNLIAKAPSLKNWKFTAFKPALGFGFVNKYMGVEYDPSKLWFLPLEKTSDPSAIGIKIGIPNFDEKTHIHSRAALWIILDTGLGELVAAQDIQFMETGALPSDPEKEGYIELIELPKYLEWKKSKSSKAASKL